MTENQQAALMIEGLITHLPEAEQVKFRECYAKLDAIVTEYGDAGIAALGLLGARKSEDL
jgi:hypothetical protein